MVSLRVPACIVMAVLTPATHAAAMGSGPHPNVALGIPLPTHNPPASHATAVPCWETPLFWIPLLLFAAMVLWSIPPAAKK